MNCEEMWTEVVQMVWEQCLIILSNCLLQCDWFFSSWDEDVNVPVDEVPTEPVPISAMSEQLLAKAESLGQCLCSLSTVDTF